MRHISVGVGALLSIIVGSTMGSGKCSASERPDTPVSDQGESGHHTEIRQGVKGRVISTTGRPISDTLITAISLDVPAKPVPEIAILTEGDGSYSWPLRPGNYEIAVALGSHQAASERVMVRHQQITRLDFVLPE